MSSPFKTGFLISSWYASNIGVLLLNKYLLSVYGFKYPVFLTMCHMMACSVMSYLVAGARIFSAQAVKSRSQFFKIATLAVVFCVSVVLGNASLRFIPVSFNQAIGATTPAFTAALSALVLANRETREVYITLIPVIVGIVIASGGEPMFDMVGFTMAIAATGARAFKSVLQSLLLSDANDKMDSLNLLMYMAPVATIALIPATLLLEDNALSTAMHLGATDPNFFFMLGLNSALAYVVNLTNFLVTKQTSALTLQVIGNAKGVFAVGISVMIFRNPVNFYSVFGYLITVTGVVLYSRAKRAAQKLAAAKALDQKVVEPLLGKLNNGNGMAINVGAHARAGMPVRNSGLPV